MKRKRLYIIIVLLLAVLALLLTLLLAIAWRLRETSHTDPTGTTDSTTNTPESTTQPTPPTTQPTVPPTTEPTVPPTTEPTVPPTTEPAVPPTTEPAVPPTTEPAVDPDSTFGLGLYTWGQLDALSTQKHPYGPGITDSGHRPPYPDQFQERYQQYGANFIGPDNDCVYLTFDCGYEYYATDENGNAYRVTERILDVLREKNVSAVFFITMSYAQKQPDLVQRMIDEGHAVGNHSCTHPVMPNISIHQMIDEVMGLHSYVLDRFGYEMHLFRPPTGAYSEQSLAAVQNLGYKTVHWSVAHRDYEPEAQPTPAEAYATVTGRHHSGAIYLLHAISETNAAILGDVIDFLRNQGYSLELFV